MATYYVDPDATGGTYNGLSWATAYRTLDACLTARYVTPSLTEAMVINCRSSGGTADTTAVVVDGGWANATYGLTIQVAQADRAVGKVDTSKYRVDVSAGGGTAFRIADDYVTIIGVQCRNTGANGERAFRVVNKNVVLRECIAYGQLGTGGAFGGFCTNSGGGAIHINCFATDCAEAGFYTDDNDSRFYNCVSIANGGHGYEIGGYVTFTGTNCYAGGNGGASSNDADANTTFTLTTCASDDGVFGASTIAYTASGSAGTRFTSITNGSEDIHIAEATSSLISAGTDLTATFTTDIDGTTRRSGSAWDIGCHEYVGGAPAGHPAMARWNGIPGMRYSGRKGW
jgi:hypothetical protein